MPELQTIYRVLIAGGILISAFAGLGAVAAILIYIEYARISRGIHVRELQSMMRWPESSSEESSEESGESSQESGEPNNESGQELLSSDSALEQDPGVIAGDSSNSRDENSQRDADDAPDHESSRD